MEQQTPTIELDPIQKAWADFNIKCADLGKIEYNIEQLKIQKHNTHIDVTNLLDKYNKLVKEKQETPPTETKQ